MLAKLLRSPGKVHTFTDDLESFLHVLGWMTLRYVPADSSYRPLDRGRDLSMFDEYCVTGYNDEGRFQKCFALRGNSYPSDTFQPRKPTPLSDLIAELSKPFKSLYAARPPTAEDRTKINVALNPSDRILFRLRATIDQYDEDMQLLQSSLFFIDEMQRALDNNDWPTDDKADTNLPIASSGRHTEKRAQIKTSRLQHTHSLWEGSKGLSRSSKRAASPTPESSAKRRRGTPAASESQV